MKLTRKSNIKASRKNKVTRKVMANYGYTLNGDEITESDVEELYRVANNEILQMSNVYHEFGETPEILEDTFSYSQSGTAFGAYLEYSILCTATNDTLDIYSFQRLNHDELMVDFNGSGDFEIEFVIHVYGDKIYCEIGDYSVYDNSQYSEYFTDAFQRAFDFDRMCEIVAESFESVVNDIKVTLSNF